jgi:hypothetical protein
MDPSGTRWLEEEEQAWRIGHVIDVDDRWSFSFDAWQHAVSSSGRKRIFWGTFVDESRRYDPDRGTWEVIGTPTLG